MLDCWMPLDVPRDDGGKLERAARQPIALGRTLPFLQPVAVGRYAGSLGVRRPGDWVGRFDPLRDTEPISDESFVNAWGNLPDEPLTLCGTSRFVRDCCASLATGPTPTKIQIRPTVDLKIDRGRIAMTVHAEIIELSGQLARLEAEIPENLHVVDTIADGLSSWTVDDHHRLRMMFDRPTAKAQKSLRIFGWIPLDEDPLKTGSRRHRITIPWIGWHGMEGSYGILNLSSVTQPEIQGSAGLSLIASESSSPGGATAPKNRLTFRVDDPEKLGELAWESSPPRVSVGVESQIAVLADSVEWVAVLRYDVLGGALDVIHLKMPVAWSTTSGLRLSGDEYQLTTETRGPFAYWSITPRRPIRGSERFVLHAVRSLTGEREIIHPELRPLGNGSVDATLGIVNATARPIASTARWGW